MTLLFNLLVLPRLDATYQRSLIQNRVRELQPEIERQAGANRDYLMQIRSLEGRVWARVGVVLVRVDTLYGGGMEAAMAGWQTGTVLVRLPNDPGGRLLESITFDDTPADPAREPETSFEGAGTFSHRWEWRYWTSVPIQLPPVPQEQRGWGGGSTGDGAIGSTTAASR